MMNGKNATVSLSSGINGASITSADVFTSNGVIHVIDAVLTPSDDQEETGDSSSGATDEDDDWMTYLYIGIGIIVLAGIAGLLFARRGGAGGDMTKNFGQNNIINDLPIMPGNIFTAQPSGYVAQEQAAQPAYQAQPIAQQPAYQPQPVVAEPQVTNQWTDTNGHTWRSMSDGSTLWWNGTDWQKAA